MSLMIKVALFLFLILLLSHCGQTPTTDLGPTLGTFSHVYEKTLKTTCTECHVPTSAVYKDDGVLLDFSSKANAYSTLTALSVTGGTSKNKCGAAKIVTSGSPEKSYLAAVLFTEYNISNFAGITDCLPYPIHLTDQHLSSDEKLSFVTWIKNGAKND